ncbi:MAG TPA: uracil-DNA glycosylase family protein [Gallionella sp.]
MDRDEAILRELNLHPQWVRRKPAAAGQPEQVTAHAGSPEVVRAGVVEASEPAPVAQPGREPVRSAEKRADPASLSAAVPTTAPGVGSLDWPELKLQVRDCTICRLRAGCTQTVFGVGDEQADWLFVGEGPGADEDALGEPFVGQAGKLLDNMLLAIGLKRGRNAYIANIVKCRPPNNRTPEADEIAACLPYLRRQIELIQPKLIVALGKVASNALLGQDATLASLRGTVHEYHGIPLVVTYHPAYLLRSPSEKVKAWQDLCLAVRTIGS